MVHVRLSGCPSSDDALNLYSKVISLPVLQAILKMAPSFFKEIKTVQKCESHFQNLHTVDAFLLYVKEMYNDRVICRIIYRHMFLLG